MSEKTYRCYLCGNTKYKILYRDNIYNIKKCLFCGLGVCDPLPTQEELNKYYNDCYFESSNHYLSGYKDYIGDENAHYKSFLKKFKLLKKFKQSGKILDVGCAAGYFLDIAQKNNWEVFGVDVSKKMIDYAKNKFYLNNLFIGPFENQNFNQNFFDVITFYGTFEHFLNPSNILRKCHNLLRDNGLLILEIPNINALSVKIMKSHWWFYKPGEHLYHFTPKNIKLLLNQENFKILKFTYESSGRYANIEFLIEKIAFNSKFVGKILKILLKPFYRKIIYINSFDVITIIAQKINEKK